MKIIIESALAAGLPDLRSGRINSVIDTPEDLGFSPETPIKGWNGVQALIRNLKRRGWRRSSPNTTGTVTYAKSGHKFHVVIYFPDANGDAEVGKGQDTVAYIQPN